MAQSISWLHVQVCFCKLTRFPFQREALAWITKEKKVSLLCIDCEEQHVYASCSMITYGGITERILPWIKFYFSSHLLFICFSFFSQGLTLESIYSDWLDRPGIPKVRPKSTAVAMYFELSLFFIFIFFRLNELWKCAQTLRLCVSVLCLVHTSMHSK